MKFRPIAFLFVLLFLLILYIRQLAIIQKIRRTDPVTKSHLVNQLLQPFGFFLIPARNLISSIRNPWQRTFGYQALFDRSAPHFNMIFDCEPVRFDYQGQTWLLEFWKGQYGINTGCEIGLYHADRILTEEEYSTAHFEAASDQQLLPMHMKLYEADQILLELEETHWWLTAFLPGCFSQPERLTLEASVTFPDFCMQQSFLGAMLQLGYRMCELNIHGLTVSFRFTTPHAEAPRTVFPFYRRWVQWKNRFFCRLYRFAARPFLCTEDRLLYLFCSLPAAFRHILRFRKNRNQRPPRRTGHQS